MVQGEINVPGDKSITHRVLLAAGMAPGRSQIRGALSSLDTRSTARLLRAAGVEINRLARGRDLIVSGLRRWRRPDDRLDCGNSGTTARLSLGILAGHPFPATLTGDRSLRTRPMARVTQPLALMGARFEGRHPDRLPLTVRGGALRSLAWELPVSSAQIKSALLLAGVTGKVSVRLREPGGLSRDHTERLLRSFGYVVRQEDDGWLWFEPTGRMLAFSYDVPGDISSAAFFVAAALVADRGELTIRDVGLNPTRTGFLGVVARMGAGAEVANRREAWDEPRGDLHVRPTVLTATTVRAAEIPGLIDEIPVLACLAARAQGTSVFEEVGELRVKESNRLALLAQNLRALGYVAAATDNNLTVTGSDRPPRGRVKTEGDHRIAMAFAVLGTVAGARIAIDDRTCAEVSFPGFDQLLRSVRGSR